MKLQAIINEAQKKRQFTGADLDLIRRAHIFASQAHAGQKRRSGEPYLIHVEEAALNVARWQLDAPTIAAALLHDVIEDCGVSRDVLEKEFGSNVAFLVEGVTKIGKVKYRGNQAQAETLKKMILALSEDVRVVFVKLADRLHNMDTLGYLPMEKRRRIALETEEIYAPLAYRLGLTNVSGQLYDLTFPFLYPKEHRLLSDMMRDHLRTGQSYVDGIKDKIENEIKKQSINLLRIDTRAKRLSSLFKKMRRYDMNIERIYDLVALRIIVKDVTDCYATLGLIHQLWPPLPGLIKDYIALPKPNGYRGIHTTVICDGGKPTEFQIRTEEMHRENEYGIAAYWAYSEAKNTKGYQQEHKKTIFADARQLAWINQLKNWQKELIEDSENEDPLIREHSEDEELRRMEAEEREGYNELEDRKGGDFVNALKIDFFKDRIFVITPKGEVIDLPSGATPVDFAYAIHSQIGDSCTGAKVNGRIVPLDAELQSGDVLEIMLNKNKKKPNEAWLQFVKTSRARTRIKNTLRTQGGGLVPVTLRINITAEDRMGLMKDVSSLMAQSKVPIVGVQTSTNKDELAVMKLTINTEPKEKLDRLLLKLRRIQGVKQVTMGGN